MVFKYIKLKKFEIILEVELLFGNRKCKKCEEKKLTKIRKNKINKRTNLTFNKVNWRYLTLKLRLKVNHRIFYFSIYLTFFVKVWSRRTKFQIALFQVI